MFEAARFGTDIPSTPARLAATAARYGYDGLVLRQAVTESGTVDATAISDAYGIDVATGIEIRGADPAQCSGYIGTYRTQTPVLIVVGGPGDLNRFAARQDRVDVLSATRWEPGSLDHVLARTAADHGVRLEVNLHPVLRGTGGDRVRAITALRRLVDLVTAYDCPYVVTGAPTGHLEFRAPRDLAAVGGVIGADAEWLEAGFREWARIVDANRDRLDGAVVAPGVRRGRDDP